MLIQNYLTFVCNEQENQLTGMGIEPFAQCVDHLVIMLIGLIPKSFINTLPKFSNLETETIIMVKIRHNSNATHQDWPQHQMLQAEEKRYERDFRVSEILSPLIYPGEFSNVSNLHKCISINSLILQTKMLIMASSTYLIFGSHDKMTILIQK